MSNWRPVARTAMLFDAVMLDAAVAGLPVGAKEFDERRDTARTGMGCHRFLPSVLPFDLSAAKTGKCAQSLEDSVASAGVLRSLSHVL